MKQNRREFFGKPAQSYEDIKIPNGSADIASHLGLKPENTIWDFDWVHSDDSGVKWPTSVYEAGESEDVVLLSRGTATGITLKLQDGLLSYLKKHAGVKDIIEVTVDAPAVKYAAYPDHSVIAQATDKFRNDQRLRKAFEGKTFCSWTPGNDVQRNVIEMGGQTLISTATWEKFNSKARIMREAANDGYNVSRFVVAESWAELDARMQELKAQAESLGIDPEKAKYWVKFDNLSGGEGVMPYKPQEASFDDIKKWIMQVNREIGLGENEFHPIVIDIDLGQLPGIKRIVNNFCVQGVIGPEGCFMTGTTLQRTEDGTYVGGSLPLSEEDKAYAHLAKAWAQPVFKAAQAQGYVGYAGVDVIMAEGEDGQAYGFILEMNGRLCTSTPLLATSHWVERESGFKEPAVVDFSEKNLGIKDFKSLKKAFNGILYRGEKSGFEGVMPVHFNLDEKGDIYSVKMIAVARDHERLQRLEERYKKVFTKLRKA